MNTNTPIIHGVNMTPPNGYWETTTDVQCANVLLFAPDVSHEDAETYLVSHPLLGCPAYYWGAAPESTERRIEIPVFDPTGKDNFALEFLFESAAPSNSLTWHISSSNAALDNYYNVFKTLLQNRIKSCNENWLVDILFPCLREGIENAARHGHKWDPEKYITLTFLHTPKKLWVEVIDSGAGFDWYTELNKAKSLTPAEIALSRLSDVPGGIGMPMMTRALDVVQYNEAGNKIRMAKIS